MAVPGFQNDVAFPGLTADIEELEQPN
jgi:hypothetical protein